MFTTFTQIIRIFQQRRQRIRRNLEAARLRDEMFALEEKLRSLAP